MKHKNYLASVLLLLCLYTSGNSSAQTTGSFDTTITFLGAPRAVSIYVPASYSASTPYRLMVCLHGLGDTCNGYRNALITSLAWGTNIPNTIFICPEANTRYSDYYYPAGNEAIIQSCIDLAMANYHIDSSDVILQGFSLGGRAALRYGLDNYTKFKGLLLNTPAVQGVKEAINSGVYHFTYANASHIPIYITHGGSDILYSSPIDSAYEQMVLQDGKVRLYDFPGLGHAIPPITSILNFIPFFNTPAAPGYDLDMVKATIAQRSCVTTLPATCLVRNTGSNTIHTINLNYTVAGSTLTYTWTGALASFQHAVVSLPAITSPVGSQTLTVTVASLESGVTDTITSNNTKATPYIVQTIGTALPLFEGFEGAFPPAGWVQYFAGDAYSPWDVDNTVMKTGAASMGAFNTILIFDNSGRKEDIASPVLDLTSISTPHLNFDVSYNYHHYTPPFLTIDTVFADTLSVLVSTDCGDTYTTVYKKGGSNLATFANPILNPNSINADFITPADSNWRTEDIDLSAYAGDNKVIVKFSYLSALGGSINIDNVSFNNGHLAVPEVAADKMSLYPNPANDKVNISTGNEQLSELSVTDMEGRVVLSQHSTGIENKMSVNTTGLAEGVYIFKVVTENAVTNRKVIIKR